MSTHYLIYIRLRNALERQGFLLERSDLNEHCLWSLAGSLCSRGFSLSAKPNRMAKLSGIPDEYKAGISRISGYDFNTVSQISSIVEKIPVGAKWTMLQEKLSGIIPQGHEREVSRTIWSFGSLRASMIDKDNAGTELAKAFIEQNRGQGDLVDLSRKLSYIIGAAKNIETTFKASKITSAQGTILKGASTITDLRPVFSGEEVSDDFVSILLHTLHFRVEDDDLERDVTITTDWSGLQAIKAAILRAEQKEAALRTSDSAKGMRIVTNSDFDAGS